MPLSTARRAGCGSTSRSSGWPRTHRHRVLARRKRRGHLRLRLGAVLRIHRAAFGSTSPSSPWPQRRTRRILAGRGRRWRLRLRRRPLPRIDRPLRSTNQLSALRQPRPDTATGWLQPTAACSASATPGSGGRAAPRVEPADRRYGDDPGRPGILDAGSRSRQPQRWRCRSPGSPGRSPLDWTRRCCTVSRVSTWTRLSVLREGSPVPG